MSLSRPDGRGHHDPRKITIEPGAQRFPEGSVIYACGRTKVLIAASVEETVPRWMKGRNTGWVSAEYQMHPRANPDRQRRARGGQIDGRSSEIQRLIARSLRGAVNMKPLGERQITVDCDVLDADGGTRTASITGGFVALAIALDGLRKKGLIKEGVLREEIAALSVGLVGKDVLVDLAYEEDSRAEVDLNVVCTASGGLVEVQGTAEGVPIERATFDALLDAAMKAIPTLVTAQRAALQGVGVDLSRLLA